MQNPRQIASRLRSTTSRRGALERCARGLHGDVRVSPVRPKLHELCLAQSLRVPFFTHPRRVFCVKITCARAPRCEYARRAWVTMASWSSLSRWESSERMRTAQCENFSPSRAHGRKPVRRSRRSCGPRLRPVHGATCRTSTSRSKRASSTRRDRAAPRLRLCHRTHE